MAFVMKRRQMNWPEIKRYLDNIRTSIKNEIRTLINTKECGDFTVPLLFFSYAIENSERMLGKEAKGKNEELEFIFKYFPRIDTTYSDRKSIIWFFEMYRHGLSHRFTPQNFEIAPQKALVWLVYKGKRRGYSNKRRGWINISHLRINKTRCIGESTNWPKHNVYVLPVCLNALYQDLLVAFEKYVEDVRKTPQLQSNFNKWKDGIFYRLVPKYSKKH